MRDRGVNEMSAALKRRFNFDRLRGRPARLVLWRRRRTGRASGTTPNRDGSQGRAGRCEESAALFPSRRQGSRRPRLEGVLRGARAFAVT
ncbi:MAG: hypothetical protein ACRELF_07890 [Gemmataceae bacterium]